MKGHWEKIFVRVAVAVLTAAFVGGASILRDYFHSIDKRFTAVNTSIRDTNRILGDTISRIKIEENRSKRADASHTSDGLRIDKIDEIVNTQARYKEWLLMLTNQGKEDRKFMHNIDKEVGKNKAVIQERHR